MQSNQHITVITYTFKNQLKYFSLLLAVFVSTTTFTKAQDAEKGKIAGTILDAETGDTIPGANILVVGTGRGTATDIDGNYSLSLPPGVYTLRISFISYARKVITDVQVNAGEVTTVNTSLEQEVKGIGEITVTAGFNSNSEAGLLSMQRKAVSVQDGISSEQIAKLGDSDVGQAIKRVTGVTIQNGQDVFVRGLGNRYSNVQLNGSQIPSTDPNKKEAPVDLFGSDLVSNIVVQKTYSADESAEFSGGSVQITTREFPDEQSLTLSYSTKYNTVSTFDNTLSSTGSKTDFLGYDNGLRKLPSVLNDQRASEKNADQVVNSLNNYWDINQNSKAIPSQKISLNYANQFNRETLPIGVVSNFSYEYNRQLEPNKVQRSILNFSSSGVNYYSNYDEKRGVESANMSGLVNVFTKPSSLTKIGIKTLYTNSTNNSRSIIQGPYQNGSTRIGVIDFDRRTVFSASLEADTYFENFMSSTLSGQISYNRALRNRPDRRTTRYNLVGDEYLFHPFGDGNGHFFSDQKDNNYEGSLKYEFRPASFVKFSTGGNVIIKNRHFTARRISYRDQTAPYLTNQAKTLPPSQILADENIQNGTLELVETTQFQTDFYDGDQTIYAGFISSNWNMIGRLTLELGGRIEQSVQTIHTPSTPSLNSKYHQVSKVNNTDFLPAVNLTYELSDETNIRAAFSKTLARPEFREISNFDFADFFGGRRIYGNPDLKRTGITNFDLRFETYPNGGELFAVSGFYKHFENPIELFYRFTENNEVFYNNARDADLYGIEVEGRKNLMERLQLIANASYIYSVTRMYQQDVSRVANKERPMVGQSPYTINISSFYTIPDWNMNVTLSYNTFGKRIVTVGRNAQQDDEYEQPFHSVGAKLDYNPGFAKFTFEVSNMLNQQREYKQNGITTYRFNPGVTFELGVSLSL